MKDRFDSNGQATYLLQAWSNCGGSTTYEDLWFGARSKERIRQLYIDNDNEWDAAESLFDALVAARGYFLPNDLANMATLFGVNNASDLSGARAKLAAGNAAEVAGILGTVAEALNEPYDWVVGANELMKGNLMGATSFLPFFSYHSIKVLSESANLTFHRLAILSRVSRKVVESDVYKELKKLDPNMKIGIRGSTARGVQCDEKGGKDWNSAFFDMDIFVQSDYLAHLYEGKARGLGDLGEALRAEWPEMFAGLKKGNKGTSVRFFREDYDVGEGALFFQE